MTTHCDIVISFVFKFPLKKIIKLRYLYSDKIIYLFDLKLVLYLLQNKSASHSIGSSQLPIYLAQSLLLMSLLTGNSKFSSKQSINYCYLQEWQSSSILPICAFFIHFHSLHLLKQDRQNHLEYLPQPWRSLIWGTIRTYNNWGLTVSMS